MGHPPHWGPRGQDLLLRRFTRLPPLLALLACLLVAVPVSVRGVALSARASTAQLQGPVLAGNGVTEGHVKLEGELEGDDFDKLLEHQKGIETRNENDSDCCFATKAPEPQQEVVIVKSLSSGSQDSPSTSTSTTTTTVGGKEYFHITQYSDDPPAGATAPAQDADAVTDAALAMAMATEAPPAAPTPEPTARIIYKEDAVVTAAPVSVVATSAPRLLPAAATPSTEPGRPDISDWLVAHVHDPGATNAPLTGSPVDAEHAQKDTKWVAGQAPPATQWPHWMDTQQWQNVHAQKLDQGPFKQTVNPPTLTPTA